jgi:molecular chaperone DnaK (HSP70)
MVREAEEFAEQDAQEKGNVEARNQLEAYLYNLKSSINDTLEGKLDASDKDELSRAIEDTLVWLEDNPAAVKDDCNEKQKAVENLANPILKKAYESAANAGDDDFMGADLDGAGDHIDENEPSVEEVD